MRALFTNEEDTTLFVLEIFSAFYEPEDSKLVFVPAGEGYEVVIPNISGPQADKIMSDLYATGMYDLSQYPATLNYPKTIELPLPFF